jgi:hypothetical protein
MYLYVQLLQLGMRPLPVGQAAVNRVLSSWHAPSFNHVRQYTDHPMRGLIAAGRGIYHTFKFAQTLARP